MARDPGGRGLAGRAAAGTLERAARSLLAARATCVVSGFAVPTAEGLRPESDGPPGAAALARALRRAGGEAFVLCDELSAPLFVALGEEPQVEGWQVGDPAAARLLDERRLSHVVAVERPGRTAAGDYRSMRGVHLEAAALDELLVAAEAAGVERGAIGDGGNEAGVAGLLGAGLSLEASCATVVGADWALGAGVSNWAAYALVAALGRLAGEDLLPSAGQARADHEAILAAGAVDGVLGQPVLSVDGEPWESTAALLAAARAAMIGAP